MISAAIYVAIFLAIASSYRNRLVSSILFGMAYGLSYQLGHADFISYTTLYEGLKTEDQAGLKIAFITGHYEPIYIITALLSASSGINYYVYRFFLYAVSFYVFLRYLDKTQIQDKAIFLLLFFSLTSFTHLFSVDRQAISLILSFAAILTTSTLLRFIPLGFHLSSAVLVAPVLLRKSRRITILSSLFLIAMAFFYFDKYYYLISGDEKQTFSITNSIICIALAVELFMTSRSAYQRDSTVKILLAVCLTLGLITLPFPAIFYRLKAIFILLILLSYFSRPHRHIFDQSSRLTFAVLIAYLISIFYVISDPLAFDGYQNVLLDPLMNYKDKTESWWEIFQD